MIRPILASKWTWILAGPFLALAFLIFVAECGR